MRWRWTHPTFAFLSSVFLIWLLVRAAHRPRRQTHWDNRGLSALVLVLLAAQYVLGVLDVFLLAPVWMQVAHLLGADVLWSALVVLTARLTLEPVGEQRSQRQLGLLAELARIPQQNLSLMPIPLFPDSLVPCFSVLPATPPTLPFGWST